MGKIKDPLIMYVLISESIYTSLNGDKIHGIYCKGNSKKQPPRIRQPEDIIPVGFQNEVRVDFLMEGDNNCLFESKAVAQGLITKAGLAGFSAPFYANHARLIPVEVYKKKGYFVVDVSSFNSQTKILGLLKDPVIKSITEDTTEAQTETFNPCARMFLEGQPKDELQSLNQECKDYIMTVYNAHGALFRQLQKQEKLILKLEKLQDKYTYPELAKTISKIVRRQKYKIRQKAEEVISLFDADQFEDAVLTIRNS